MEQACVTVGPKSEGGGRSVGRLAASPALSDSDHRRCLFLRAALCYLLNRLDLQSSSQPCVVVATRVPILQLGTQAQRGSHLSKASQ